MPGEYTTQLLADFIAGRTSADPIDDAAYASAKKSLLDTISAALAAQQLPACRAVRELTGSQFASGDAGIWFAGRHQCVTAAAMANSFAASALDLDDGHRLAMGHPGAAIIPAALAVAEALKSSPTDILDAIVLGYETAVRIAAARDLEVQDTLSTGRWCAYGCVAAAARLESIPAPVVAQALAIAGVYSPGLSAAGYSTVMGNNTKEGIGWGTMTGLLALGLAKAGFSGPLDILDHPDYFDASQILSDLGRSYQISSVYYKVYACCRWIHSAIEALDSILVQNPIHVDEIVRLDVHTFDQALRLLTNDPAPHTNEGAQYSIPFCLAVTAILGTQALLPLDAAIFEDKRIEQLARKVVLHSDSEMTSAFPSHTPACVVVTTSQGQYEQSIVHPLGDPANPISWDRLAGKFIHLAQDRIEPERAEQIVVAVTDFEHVDATILFDLLSEPTLSSLRINS